MYVRMADAGPRSELTVLTFESDSSGQQGMKASVSRLRLQFSKQKRASFIEEMGPGITIISYLENTSFESRTRPQASTSRGCMLW